MLYTVRAAIPAAVWSLGRAFSSARLEPAVTLRRQESQYGWEDQRPGQGGRPHSYPHARYAIPDNRKGYAAVLVQESKSLLTSCGALTQHAMLRTEMLFGLHNSQDAKLSPDVPLLCTLKLQIWAMWSAPCFDQLIQCRDKTCPACI